MEIIKTSINHSDLEQAHTCSLENECSKASHKGQLFEAHRKNRARSNHISKCTHSNWTHHHQGSNGVHCVKNLRASHCTPFSIMWLVCCVVLCVGTLHSHSVSCLVIKSQDNVALNNCDSHDHNDYGAHYVHISESELSSQDDDASYAAEVSKSEIECNSTPCQKAAGKLSYYLPESTSDSTVHPCEDFYQFTCRKYINDHPVPAYVKSWSHFQNVFYSIRTDIKRTLKSKDILKGNEGVFSTLYDFYDGCTNKKQRESSGYTSLLKLIDDIVGWPMFNPNWDPNSFHWEKTYVKHTRLNLFFFLRIEPMADLKDPSKTIIKIGPPYKTKENIVNLGMFKIPRTESEYAYSFEGRAGVEEDEDLVEDATPAPNPQQEKATATYKEVLKELKVRSLADPSQLNMTQFDQILGQNLQLIYKLQDELQRNAQPVKPLESYQLTYNESLKTLGAIQKMVKFDITGMVGEIFNITPTDDQELFVPDIVYLTKLDELLHSHSKSELANYFATNLAIQMAAYTTPKMINLLVTKLDEKSNEILENLCFEQTSEFLPELLGKLYITLPTLTEVPENFSKWQSDVSELRNWLSQSFEKQLRGSWMDEMTKEKAIAKLKSMSVNIGFPDWFSNPIEFKAYCDSMFTDISSNDYFTSVVNANQAGQKLTTQELTERLHKSALTSWPGHRQIIDVNAFYYFTTNGVYIPAAIAQFPFFYEQGLPSAVSFGSMGMILGHEMTHAFDITGRLYDHQGALKDWWSPQTDKQFRERADCFAKQYSSYSIDSFRINGERTLAENIADNGGLREAYGAFKLYSEQHPTSPQRLPSAMASYTADQLFFISFASMWCEHMDPDLIESDINKNAHSPASIRVLGTLANFPEFATAFNCSATSKMYSKDRCQLW